MTFIFVRQIKNCNEQNVYAAYRSGNHKKEESMKKYVIVYIKRKYESYEITKHMCTNCSHENVNAVHASAQVAVCVSVPGDCVGLGDDSHRLLRQLYENCHSFFVVVSID